MKAFATAFKTNEISFTTRMMLSAINLTFRYEFTSHISIELNLNSNSCIKGPCKDDEWLVLKSQGTPQCEVVPSGCLADGMHVFWPADGKCYKLGKKGPCTESNHVLQRNEHLDVSCMHSSVNTLIEKRPWGQLPRINPNMATIDLQRRASRFLCPPAGRMNQTGTGYCNHMMGH